MEDLDSESNLDMTEVSPSVLPATREAPLVEPGAGAGGWKGILRHHWSLPGGPVLVASIPAVTAATATTAGTFPRL